jgi:hypothetical protein
MIRGADGPIGRSAKAWMLVIGGMIVVGAVNVIIGWKWFVPAREDGEPDAGLVAPHDAERQPGLQAPRLPQQRPGQGAQHDAGPGNPVDLGAHRQPGELR